MNPYIDRLNRTFGDTVGLVPACYSRGKAESQYKWAWAPSMTYGGTDRGEHSQYRLHDQDCWAIFKWVAPIARDEWRARYGEEITYPDGGMWAVTDFVLPVGAEPSEELTNWAIGSIIEKRSISFRECLTLAQEQSDRLKRSKQNEMNDLIDDTCLTYDAVPGKRGGMRSFGGFEQTQTT